MLSKTTIQWKFKTTAPCENKITYDINKQMERDESLSYKLKRLVKTKL